MGTLLLRWAVILFAAGCLPAVVFGQANQAKSDFKTGDKVVIKLLADQEAEVVGEALGGWPIVKFPFGDQSAEAAFPPEHLRRVDRAGGAAADQNAGGKRSLKPGDVVTLKDGTKGYLEKFDTSGYVHLVVQRGNRRIPFPHFAKIDKVVSIEPQSKEVDPRRENRTWTDITGKHTVTAKFVRVRDRKVELQKADGVVKVPLDKLSATDQKLALALAEEEDGAELTEARLAGRMPDLSRLGAFQRDTGEITAQADRSQCRDVVFDDSIPAQGLPPDPGPAPPDPGPAPPAALSERPIAIALPPGAGHVAEHPVHVAFAAAKAQALVTFQVVDHGQQRKRLVRCDLASGQVLESVEVPQETVPMDFDAEGRVFVGSTEPAWSTGRVDYIALLAGKASRIASWQADPQGIKHLALIDKDHLLTVDGPNRLTVWKAAQAKALYTVVMDRGTVPAVSGGGKYLAIAAPGGTVYVLEALTGKPLARLAGEQIQAPQLSFRPDGQQLAGVRRGDVRVWDVESGKLVHAFKVFPAHNAGTNLALAWPAEGFLLADAEKLLDLKRGILLWHFHGVNSQAQRVFAGRYWNAQRTPTGHSLTFTPLPHEQARETAAGLDAEGLLAIKPGLEVALDVRLSLPEDQQRAVRDSLVKRLEANGLKVAPRASLILHCATSTGPAQEVEYHRTDRRFRPGEKVTFSNTTCSLWFTENGKTVWVASRTYGAPGQVTVVNNDLRRAVAEQSGIDVNFLLQTPLPSRVPRPGNDPSGAYGSSWLNKLTSQ